MSYSPLRRSLLAALAAAPFASVRAQPAAAMSRALAAQEQLAKLEASSGGRLGVAARNTADGAVVEYRASERFPMCSTFKLLAVGAILKRSMDEHALLDERVRFGAGDLVAYSPVAEKHVDRGMTIGELCVAALQYSDNTAANLLLTALGGPEVVNEFARSIGDTWFDLVRWETELNASVPGDLRDTTTPQAMMRDVERLLLGDVLAVPQREMLRGWMEGNRTGGARIRSAVSRFSSSSSSGWVVADKTGSGDYGTANDVGVVFLPAAAVVIAVYFTGVMPRETTPRSEVVAGAAEIVLRTLV